MFGAEGQGDEGAGDGTSHTSWWSWPALVLAVVLAEAGLSMAWCLVVLALAPMVTVVGYETLGHRHQEEALTLMKSSL